jgi:hypothetical protein
VRSELSAWQDFFVMTGGAAAALTGLIFVAMTQHTKTIVSNPFYRSRAISMLLSLTIQLVLAGAALVPGQPLVALGLEVEIAALLFVVLWIVFSVWRHRHVPRTHSRSRRSAELLAGLLLNALLVGAGLALLGGNGAGLYLLASLLLLGFGWNIYVAWVLIAEASG